MPAYIEICRVCGKKNTVIRRYGQLEAYGFCSNACEEQYHQEQQRLEVAFVQLAIATQNLEDVIHSCKFIQRDDSEFHAIRRKVSEEVMDPRNLIMGPQPKPPESRRSGGYVSTS